MVCGSRSPVGDGSAVALLSPADVDAGSLGLLAVSEVESPHPASSTRASRAGPRRRFMVMGR